MIAAHITRRALLGGTAVIAAGLVANGAGFGQTAPLACVLTPRSAEGPFYFDPGLVRADIAEDRRGSPLLLGLQVVEVGNCRPVGGVRIDVWHADARGLYSGYRGQADSRDVSTVGQTFLRGTQFSDAAGRAAFRTFYPGWYPGRTPHVHFRVVVGERGILTGQLYFPDRVSDGLYATAAAYQERKGRRDTSNATDGLLRGRNGPAFIAAVDESAGGHHASLVIGIAAT